MPKVVPHSSDNPGVGDLVVAVKRGGQDRSGLPEIVPQVGMLYRITAIYRMRYGYGCRLEGMDPRPYKGYLLWVTPKHIGPLEPGWYFRKAEPEKVQRAVGTFKDWLGEVDNENSF